MLMWTKEKATRRNYIEKAIRNVLAVWHSADLPTHLSLCVQLLSPTATTSGRKWTSQKLPMARSSRRLPAAPPPSVPPATRLLPNNLCGPVWRRFSWFWQRPFKARVKHSSPTGGETSSRLNSFSLFPAVKKYDLNLPKIWVTGIYPWWKGYKSVELF